MKTYSHTFLLLNQMVIYRNILSVYSLIIARNTLTVALFVYAWFKAIYLFCCTRWSQMYAFTICLRSLQNKPLFLQSYTRHRQTKGKIQFQSIHVVLRIYNLNSRLLFFRITLLLLSKGELAEIRRPGIQTINSY